MNYKKKCPNQKLYIAGEFKSPLPSIHGATRQKMGSEEKK